MANSSDDVAVLWQRAIDKYNSNPELKSLKDMPRVDSLNGLDDIIKLREEESKKFGIFRDDGGKVAWLRGKVKKCLGPIDSIANFIAGAASTTFPPASSIYTVASYLISTAVTVKDDFDKVESFFTKMEEFMTRLSILKDDIPKEVVLQEHLVKILEAFLTLCGISSKYVTSKHFRHFLSNMFHGGADEKLADAYSKMLNLVDEETRIVANTILKLVQNIDNNVKLGIDIGLRGADAAGRAEAILREETEKMELDRKIGDDRFDILKAMLEELPEKLQPVQKPDNMEKLKQTIVTYFETNTGAEGKLTKFSTARLPGTATWILDEPEYLSWLENNSPLLWVSGPPGAGKTHISSLMIQELRKRFEDVPRSSVAHFFIRYAEKDTRSLKNALASAIIRISDTDEVYCKRAAAEVSSLKKEAASLAEAQLEVIWQRFFLDQYTTESNAKLYFIFDGLDEADVDERNDFFDQVDRLGNDGPVGIKLLLVGQPSLDDSVTHLTTTWVHRIFVSSTKNSKDLTDFLNKKLDTDRNIRRRPWWKEVREQVLSTLLENAKGMFLYVALMFDELHKKTQKEEVLKAILPENLPRGLPGLWARVLAVLTEETQYAGKDVMPLRLLLAFVTFGDIPLSLQDLSSIIQVMNDSEDYDVKREVEELCASIFTFSTSYTGMINEVRLGTKEEALWLFGQILGMQDPNGELKSIEAESSSRTEGLFAKGTVLQLRHLSLGDYLRDRQFKGTVVAPTVQEAGVEIALALMRASALGKHVGRSEDFGGVIYLHDIDIDACTAKQVADVAEALHSLFELFLSTNGLISPPLDRLHSATHRPYILKWLVRAQKIAFEVVKPETKSWVEEIVTNTHAMYSQLGEHYVKTWFAADCTDYNFDAFERCFDATQQESFSEEQNEQRLFLFKWLADRLPQGSGYLPHLKLALSYSNLGEYNEFGDCKFHLEESLRLATTDAERHQVLIHTVNIYDRFFQRDPHGLVSEDVYQESTKVEKTVEKMLLEASQLDLSTASSERDVSVAQESLLVLARRYEWQGEASGVLDIYRKVKKLSRNRDWEMTKKIINHLAGNDEEIMKELESWSELLDEEFWMANEPSTSDLLFQRSFQKAAMNTKKLPVLLRFYEGSIKQWQDTPMESAFKCQYAWSLQHLAGQPERARKLFEEIFEDTAYLLVSDLDRSVAQYLWTECAYNIAVRLIARDDYSLMLYQEAAAEGTTEARKNELLSILLKLPPNDYALVEWIKAGRPVASDNRCVPRLLMKLGRQKEAREQLEGEFLQSIELLNDDIPYNDSEAFVKLSRVLECAGLQQRAKEALSAIFSFMEPPSYEYEEGSYDDEPDETESAPETNSDGQSPVLDDLDELPGSEPGLIPSDPDEHSYKQYKDISLKIPHIEDETSTDAENVVSPRETNGSVNEQQGDEKSENGENFQQTEFIEWRPVFDEDLSNVAFFCDSCGVEYTDWHHMQPLYFCVYCANVSFCEECFEKIPRAGHEKRPLEKWEELLCDVAHHQFLKGPVEGWGGVKNGVMTIGERKIHWKDWLKEVQDDWRQLG